MSNNMNSFVELRKQFASDSDRIHFDNASLSLMPKKVIDCYKTYFSNRNNNGPEYHEYWKTVERTRFLCAKKIDCFASDIFFIQSTSMGLNFVAKALHFSNGDNIIITDDEFPSNLFPWMNLKENGVELRFAKKVNEEYGLQSFLPLIDKNTKLISCSWVISKDGTVVDVQEIGEYCKENEILFCIDGIQGLGAIPFSLKEVHCDFFVSGFFKWLLGPDGIAFVYIRPKLLNILSFPWLGWAGMVNPFDVNSRDVNPVIEAKRFETGNMNYSALIALEKSLELTDGLEEQIYDEICTLSSYFKDRLLDIKGIYVKSNSQTKSGILLIDSPCIHDIATALKNNKVSFTHRNGIRFSLHFYNTKQEVDRVCEIIDIAIKERKKEHGSSKNT